MHEGVSLQSKASWIKLGLSAALVSIKGPRLPAPQMFLPEVLAQPSFPAMTLAELSASVKNLCEQWGKLS
jgi:hypothetical protein